MHGDVCTEVHDGVTYRWYAAPESRGSAWARWRSAVGFGKALMKDADRLVQEVAPHVVIAAGAHGLDFSAARHIATRANAMLVHELQRVGPLGLRTGARLPSIHPLVMASARAEREICRDADLVFSQLSKAHAHLQSKGLDLRKLHGAPTGTAPRHWMQQDVLEPLRVDVAQAIERAHSRGYTVVGYVGALGPTQAFDPLLDAAELLKQERFAFTIVGDGPEREALVQNIKARKLNTAIVLPPVPQNQVPTLLAAFDLVYLGSRLSPTDRLGAVSQELVNAMMAGCTIVQATDDQDDLVREAECGVNVALDDPRGLARALRQLSLLGRRDRVEMGSRGRAWVKLHLTYPVIAKRYLDAMMAEWEALRQQPTPSQAGSAGPGQGEQEASTPQSSEPTTTAPSSAMPGQSSGSSQGKPPPPAPSDSRAFEVSSS